MYCVTCGTPLCDKNGEGLICRTCKQGQRKEKNRNKAPPGLEVKYCFVCGDLYCPNDASIRHLYHLYGLTEREETTSNGMHNEMTASKRCELAQAERPV